MLNQWMRRLAQKHRQIALEAEHSIVIGCQFTLQALQAIPHEPHTGPERSQNGGLQFICARHQILLVEVGVAGTVQVEVVEVVGLLPTDLLIQIQCHGNQVEYYQKLRPFKEYLPIYAKMCQQFLTRS